MTAIKKIICSLDFSPAAENALSYAFRLADVYQAEVKLLHVLEPVSDAMLEIPQTVPTINRKLLDDARINLQKLAEDTLTKMGDQLKNEITLTTEVEIGPVGITINELAEEEADLIVVGTRGAAGKPWWMSSVSKDIIDHPTVPVLIVPAAASYQPLDRISFATDLHRADVVHLLKLVDFLKPQQPELRCLHIVTNDDERTEMDLDELMDVFKNQLQGVNITFHQSEEEDTTEALEAFNLMYHIDLQVLVRPRRNFFQELFHRSQSKRTAEYTHVPLLIWPGQERFRCAHIGAHVVRGVVLPTKSRGHGGARFTRGSVRCAHICTRFASGSALLKTWGTRYQGPKITSAASAPRETDSWVEHSLEPPQAESPTRMP